MSAGTKGWSRPARGIACCRGAKALIHKKIRLHHPPVQTVSREESKPRPKEIRWLRLERCLVLFLSIALERRRSGALHVVVAPVSSPTVNERASFNRLDRPETHPQPAIYYLRRMSNESPATTRSTGHHVPATSRSDRCAIPRLFNRNTAPTTMRTIAPILPIISPLHSPRGPDFFRR